MNKNDIKYNEYKKSKIINYIKVFLLLAVMVLEILALFNVISMIWGLLVFVFTLVLKKM